MKDLHLCILPENVILDSRKGCEYARHLSILGKNIPGGGLADAKTLRREGPCCVPERAVELMRGLMSQREGKGLD